jgi:uncharacterized protein YodC (DUF2158 family)
MRHPLKIGDSLVLYRGTIDLTNYNTTAAEITGITGKFKDGAPTVLLSGVSESGYLCHWDTTDKAVKAFYPTITGAAHTHAVAVTAGTAGDAVTNNAGVLESTGGQDLATETGGAITAAAGTEVANDVDVGTVEFIAVGLR